MRLVLFFLIIVLVASSGYAPAKEITLESLSGCAYKDGKHEVTVYYSNSNSGHSHTYLLSVEVRDCMVIVIYWPSGGWSDNDHVTPGEIVDGEALVRGEGGKNYRIVFD